MSDPYWPYCSTGRLNHHCVGSPNVASASSRLHSSQTTQIQWGHGSGTANRSPDRDLFVSLWLRTACPVRSWSSFHDHHTSRKVLEKPSGPHHEHDPDVAHVGCYAWAGSSSAAARGLTMKPHLQSLTEDISREEIIGNFRWDFGLKQDKNNTAWRQFQNSFSTLILIGADFMSSWWCRAFSHLPQE